MSDTETKTRGGRWILVLVCLAVVAGAIVERERLREHFFPTSEPEHSDVAYHVCPMHPSVKSDVPGSCPLCSMPLEEVTKEELTSGRVSFDPARLQRIGVKTTPVKRRNIEIHIRAPGTVVYDETRVADVALRYPAWIGELYVNRPGQKVSKGQRLFTVYSSDIYFAQREYIGALELEGRGGISQVDDAILRLKRLNVADSHIKELRKTMEATDYVPIAAEVGGYVVEKNLVEGAGVRAGERLLRIARLDKVWIEAEIYLADLPLISEGTPGTVVLSQVGGKSYTGEVSFVYPYLAEGSPTGKVRIVIDNTELEIRPGMFVDVDLVIDRGERLAIPETAVIYSGPRRLVFVSLGEGRFEPREIGVGLKSDDYYEVESGLEAGEVVVTSANFLIAAESRLKSATGTW